MYRIFFAGLVSIMITGQALALADDSGWVDDGVAYYDKAKPFYDLGSDDIKESPFTFSFKKSKRLPRKKTAPKFGFTDYAVYDLDYFDGKLDAKKISSRKTGKKWDYVTEFIPDEPVNDRGSQKLQGEKRYTDVGGYVDMGGLDDHKYKTYVLASGVVYDDVEKGKSKVPNPDTYRLGHENTYWADAAPVFQGKDKATFVEDFYPRASGKTKANGTAGVTDLYYTQDTDYGYGTLAPKTQKKSDGSYDYVYIEPDTYLDPVELVYGPEAAEKKKAVGYETYQDYEILYDDPPRASASKGGLPVSSLMPLFNFGKNTSSLIILSCTFILALAWKHIWAWMKLFWRYGGSTYAEERFKLNERLEHGEQITWLDRLMAYVRVLGMLVVVMIGYDIPIDKAQSD